MIVSLHCSDVFIHSYEDDYYTGLCLNCHGCHVILVVLLVQVLSKDCVTVAVDAVVFYRVVNPTSVALNISNYSASTQDLAATTLRNVMGTCNLSDILTQRDVLAKNIQATLDEATERWGVQVERVEIKDVRLPVQLQVRLAYIL